MGLVATLLTHKHLILSHVYGHPGHGGKTLNLKEEGEEISTRSRTESVKSLSQCQLAARIPPALLPPRAAGHPPEPDFQVIILGPQ